MKSLSKDFVTIDSGSADCYMKKYICLTLFVNYPLLVAPGKQATILLRLLFFYDNRQPVSIAFRNYRLHLISFLPFNKYLIA